MYGANYIYFDNKFFCSKNEFAKMLEGIGNDEKKKRELEFLYHSGAINRFCKMRGMPPVVPANNSYLCIIEAIMRHFGSQQSVSLRYGAYLDYLQPGDVRFSIVQEDKDANLELWYNDRVFYVPPFHNAPKNEYSLKCSFRIKNPINQSLNMSLCTEKDEKTIAQAELDLRVKTDIEVSFPLGANDIESCELLVLKLGNDTLAFIDLPKKVMPLRFQQDILIPYEVMRIRADKENYNRYIGTWPLELNNFEDWKKTCDQNSATYYFLKNKLKDYISFWIGVDSSSIDKLLSELQVESDTMQLSIPSSDEWHELSSGSQNETVICKENARKYPEFSRNKLLKRGIRPNAKGLYAMHGLINEVVNDTTWGKAICGGSILEPSVKCNEIKVFSTLYGVRFLVSPKNSADTQVDDDHDSGSEFRTSSNLDEEIEIIRTHIP